MTELICKWKTGLWSARAKQPGWAVWRENRVLLEFFSSSYPERTAWRANTGLLQSFSCKRAKESCLRQRKLSEAESCLEQKAILSILQIQELSTESCLGSHLEQNIGHQLGPTIWLWVTWFWWSQTPLLSEPLSKPRLVLSTRRPTDILNNQEQLTLQFPACWTPVLPEAVRSAQFSPFFLCPIFLSTLLHTIENLHSTP